MDHLSQMACAHSDLEDYGAAIRRWRELLSFTPDDANTHYNIGWALNESGRFYEAFASLEAALSIDPAHIPARNELAVSFVHTGNEAKAAAEWQRILRECSLGPQFEHASVALQRLSDERR
jgi:Flp pilus assembly protein TadD